MPDGPSLPDAQKPPDLRSQAQQQAAGWLDVANLNKLGIWLRNTLTDAAGDVIGLILRGAGKFGTTVVTALARGEDRAAPEFGELTSAAVADLFGVPPPGAGAMSRGNRGGRTAVATSVGDMLFNAFAGNAAASSGGELHPTDAPAKAFLSTMTQLALEGWLEGWIVEALSVGQIETFGELDDIISHVLGLGRASAAVHGPLVRDLIVTPLEWKLNTDHRPTLLTASTAVQQILRGRDTKGRYREDLRRQGYAEDRIDALINQGRKFFSPADVRTFYSRNEWDGVKSERHLRDQGYDEEAAHDALRLEGLKRFDSLETQEANALISAYAARDIDRADFVGGLNAHVRVASERALFTELADLRRAVNVKHLSLGQVEAMVKSGVLNLRDYRDAAAREGYQPDAITALELQLRWEMGKEKAIAEHRAEQDAERAAAKAERDAQIAARKADVDRQRALARRGNEADLERAAVRGKIPIARVEEVYAAHYDDDTVAILVGELEDAHQAYLDEQARRDQALARADRRSIDVGAIEQAFYANLLTAPELRARLGALKFSDADADLLTATAVARKSELDAAAAKRAVATNVATKKQIDLPRFERLVRRGARTMAQYVTLLESLDVDEAAIPDFVDALQLQIDDDAAARTARERAEPELQQRGLSLEQLRRAVLLGARTVDDYQRFLVDNRFTSDAQAVLLAELRADVADSDAARARRTATPAEMATPGSPVSVIRRAAQLGLIPPDAYLSRLQAAGYPDEDLEIELELLLVEIADTQAARRTREQPDAATAPAGLTLAEAERAVKVGALSIDGYRARAIELGRSPADVDVLVAVLTRELETLAAARKAHDDTALRLAAAGFPIGELDAGAKDGSVALVDYVAQLEAWGVEASEASLVGAFMAFTIESEGA